MKPAFAKQILYTFGCMFLVALLLGVVKFIQIQIAMARRPVFPPQVVTTTRAGRSEWRETFQTVGAFAATAGATLSTQESGNVARIGFESGDKVTQGQVLIELDRSVEEANLKGALARLALARQNLSRAQMLKTQSAMSVATLDEYQSRLTQAEADVQSLRGVIERKTILAPFSGRAGIRAVNMSQYVTAGSPLVPLYSVDPIHFNFSVPQQMAPLLRTSKARVFITVDAFPGREFEGEISAVNPQVNELTRAVDAQATLSNTQEELLPGMFGSVRLELGDPRELVTIPLASVQFAPYGNSVYVIERAPSQEGGALATAKRRIVQLGAKRGDRVAVSQGLSVGDEIVASGGFKLQPDSPIAVQSLESAPADEKPVVKDS